MTSDLRKHQAGYTAGTREDNQRCMKPWARREPGPGVTDAWRTDRGGYRRCGTPLAIGALRGVTKATGTPVGLLHRPCPSRVRGHPGQVQPAGAVLDHTST